MELALTALKAAKTEFLRLKAASYNAALNAKYDRLATQMQEAVDALEAEKAADEEPATPAE